MKKKSKKKEHISMKENSKSIKIVIILIITIIFLLISLIAINKYNYQDNNISEYKFYDGKFLTANFAANMLDSIEEKENIVISPLSITSSLGLIYNATDNNTKKEFEKYFKNNIDEINSFYKNALASYIVNNNKTELETYYENLYIKFDTNEYEKLTADNISKLKSKEKEELILVLKKLDYTYKAINTSDKTITKQSIEKYKLTKDDLTKNDLEIKYMIEKTIDNYESYNIKNEVININNIYINKKIEEFSKEFNNINEKNYNFLIKKLDFTNNILASTNIINEEMSNITNNKIKYIVEENDVENKDMLMVNSFYFNYKWSEFFSTNLTKLEDFYKTDDDVVTVEMMQTTVNGYLENKNAKGFVKNFEGDKYSFIGILPKNNDLKASNIDIDSLLLSKDEETKVNISIPKFNFTYDAKLKKYLKNNGVKEVFTSKANLTQMTDEKIKLSDIHHKAYIEFGEKGTASTNINISNLNSYVVDVNNEELTFNRPFYFLIIDNSNNNTLLIGKLVNP